MAERKTVAEQLDAAQNGEEFSGAILGFFTALDKARWAEEDTDG
jgi:hypothetical protein